MNDQSEQELIKLLRDQILKSAGIIANKWRKSLNGEEFSKGYWGGKSAMCSNILQFMAKHGVEMKPDMNLIVEAETLIPKGGFWCGHELNRNLGSYKAAFARKDFALAALMEETIRLTVVRARIEDQTRRAKELDLMA
jgi:hypothetical protein